MIARGGIAVLVCWQAFVGGLGLLGSAWEGRAVGLRERMLATTNERLRRRLGDDLEVAQALRTDARPGEWLVWRVDLGGLGPDGMPGPALQQRVGAMTRLRHAVYPSPALLANTAVAVLADPIAGAEQNVHGGQSMLLLQYEGEPSPEGRPGWTRLRRESRFATWRFQKD